MLNSLATKHFLYSIVLLKIILILVSCSKPINRVKDRSLLLAHIYYQNDSAKLNIFTNHNNPLQLDGIRFKNDIFTSFTPIKTVISKPIQTISFKYQNRPVSENVDIALVFKNKPALYQKVEVFLKPIDSKVTMKKASNLIANQCPIKLDNKELGSKQFTLTNSCLIFTPENSTPESIQKLLNGKSIVLDATSSISILNFQEHEVNIKNLTIDGGGSSWRDGLFLSGSLNIYNTRRVNLNTIKLTNAKGEDGINIKESTGTLEKLEILKPNLDGIDLDRSKFQITNLNVKHAGGDGLDLSKSQVTLNSANFSHIEDKAISVGENSNFDGKKLTFSPTDELWLACKDSSKCKLNSKEIPKKLRQEKVQAYIKKKFWEEPEVTYE